MYEGGWGRYAAAGKYVFFFFLPYSSVLFSRRRGDDSAPLTARRQPVSKYFVDHDRRWFVKVICFAEKVKIGMDGTDFS